MAPSPDVRVAAAGWDLAIVNYAIRLNGITGLALMKLDILDTLPEIKICTGYKLRGEEIPYFPGRLEDLEQVEPDLRNGPRLAV